MNAALAGTMERARSTFSTISLGQKVVIGLLLVGLLGGGVFFFRWITAPTQAPLFSNLASTDASAIVDELNAQGVAYELTDGGQTIMVAKDQVYDLRLTMSGQGLPAGQDTGYALLDEQGITTSEFQQQVSYQRALEGELSKTLESLEGVRSAVVHVALPEDEVFVTEEAKPTASVLLDLAPGTALSGEQIQAVDRKSTRLNSSHANISYAVFCLKKKKEKSIQKSSKAKQLVLTWKANTEDVNGHERAGIGV